MSRNARPLLRQRRNQRGAVEDRWRKRIKDADGNTIDVPSAVAGKVTRWRARYVDDAGREHARAFHRKVDAQSGSTSKTPHCCAVTTWRSATPK